MKAWHHSCSYSTQSKELWEGRCDCWQVPPQLYHGHEELKRTVEEDFPEVTADFEALLKTNVLSSTVEAGCFWRLLCTLLLSPFSILLHPPIFTARIHVPWAPEEISSWSGGED